MQICNLYLSVNQNNEFKVSQLVRRAGQPAYQEQGLYRWYYKIRL
jgi:hypothetical protein